jgi:hypothetical protein
MSGIVVGNAQTIAYIVERMIDARKRHDEVERWILRKYLMEVVAIKIKQKGASCELAKS